MLGDCSNMAYLMVKPEILGSGFLSDVEVNFQCKNGCRIGDQGFESSDLKDFEEYEDGPPGIRFKCPICGDEISGFFEVKLI